MLSSSPARPSSSATVHSRNFPLSWSLRSLSVPEEAFSMQQWTIDDLIDHWTLLPSERDQLANKTGATRLGFAVMLKAFALDGRFPSSLHDIAPAAIAYLAKQLDVAPELYQYYDWRGRSSSNHRA